MVEGTALDLVMSLFSAVTRFMEISGLCGLSSFVWLNLEVFWNSFDPVFAWQVHQQYARTPWESSEYVGRKLGFEFINMFIFSMQIALIILVIFSQKTTNLHFKSQDSKAPSKKRLAIS